MERRSHSQIGSLGTLFLPHGAAVFAERAELWHVHVTHLMDDNLPITLSVYNLSHLCLPLPVNHCSFQG